MPRPELGRLKPSPSPGPGVASGSKEKIWARWGGHFPESPKLRSYFAGSRLRNRSPDHVSSKETIL